MKKILVLFVAFTFGAAHAQMRPIENLKGVQLCFSSASVLVTTNLNADSESIRQKVRQKITDKLSAYRIPFKAQCSATTMEIEFVIDAFKSKSGTFYVYTTKTILLDYKKYIGGANIWEAGNYGTTPAQGDELAALFASQAAENLDEFAADYAKANP